MVTEHVWGLEGLRIICDWCVGGIANALVSQLVSNQLRGGARELLSLSFGR